MSTFSSIRILDKMTPHFELAFKLDQEEFPLPWSKNVWNELNLKQNHLMIFQNESQFLGFSLISFLEGDSVAHLQKICLLKNIRGKGISQIFWMQIVENFKMLGANSFYLEVEKSNEVAVHFYKKVGFLTLREVKKYYSHGDDALIMTLEL